MSEPEVTPEAIPEERRMNLPAAKYDGREVDVSPAVGRKVLAVRVSPKGDDHDYATDELVTLMLDNGTALQLRLYGDCCSGSFWTDTKQFDELVGSTIQAIEERSGAREEDDDESGVTQWHFLVFVTDKGHVTIDWRNDSNGYYDGEVAAEWVTL